MAIEDRVQELSERLSAVEAALSEQRRRRVLRESLCCPGCENKEIFHIAELMTHGLPLRVAQKGVFSIEAIGKVEIYLCSKCGYGEVQMDPSQLREIIHVKTISEAADVSEPEPYR